MVKAHASLHLNSKHPSEPEVNDGRITNPVGQTLPDAGGEGSSLLIRCRKPVLLSTFNTGTLSKAEHTEDLIVCAENSNVDTISNQEHCFYHPDNELDYCDNRNYQITSSGTENTRNATVSGVGLLLSKRQAQI